ncbi:uncharacterized protein LOC131853734, partial [Achroia grisella]|uniref:uncharacterized protein LOC131853734 n=1 Tax=Achroia grisella TaxID=688607 RepID=UPI0027D1E9DC
CLVIVSKAYKFFVSHNDISICIIRPIFISHTTIILNLVDDDINFTKCYQPEEITTLILFKGDDLSYDVMKRNLELLFLNGKPNIIIITDVITEDLLDNPVFDVIIQSHWSFMHLIVTDNNIDCKQTEIDKDILLTAERFLNDLWHRYQIVYAIIEFPLSCPRRFITFDGNKQLNDDLYNRTITIVEEEHLHDTFKKYETDLSVDFPLKINIFKRFPTTLTLHYCDNINNYVQLDLNITNGYCGLDALVLHDFIKTFKFKVIFVSNEEINSYGYMVSGRATGSLGGVIRQEIDISFNSRFLTKYADSGFDYLNYISFDSLCALTAIPDIVPLWQYPINMYSFKQWMSVIFILVIIGIVKWLFSRRFRAILTEELYKPQVYILETVWSGMFGFFLIKNLRRCFLIALCLLFSVVLNAMYQGHVNYMFTTLWRYEQMNTLQDLCDSNIPVFTSAGMLNILGAEAARNFSNNAITTIIRRMKLYADHSNDMADPRFSATIQRRSDITLVIMENYTDTDGRPLLYAIDEYFSSLYLSYIAKSGFIFTPQVRRFMMRMVEAGLPDKYYKWTRYTMRMGDIKQNPASEPRLFTEINLQEERIPFALLLCGYIVSTLIFIKEKWWDCRKTCKIRCLK